MSFRHQLLQRTLCLWAALAVMAGSAGAAELLPAGLRNLAARATLSETWPRLRSYARSQTNSEWSGWGYFLAGYQEYTSQRYPAAAQDLDRAAQTGFSLADYAVYYQAQALSQADRPQDAAVLLQNFTANFPQSPLRVPALTLRANALLAAQQPQAAVDLLAAAPESRTQPSLALLLGQACAQANHPQQAAAAFKRVYYHFPVSGSAKAAGEALQALRTQLGSDYPVPDDETRTERAEAFLKAGHNEDALKEFGILLSDEPASPMAPQWELGQVRCLVHLHRAADALQELFTHFAEPDLEAQRLALLVQVHAQQADALAVTQDLSQLKTSYPHSPAYADALSAAGMFYYRQLNWQEAARDYQRLYELFPQSEHLREDGWRLAWCDYLLGDPKTTETIRDYLAQFPDSPRAPAALYWLGRVEEAQGALTDARALYALLVKQFVHTYYAPLASARLAAIPPQENSAATDAAAAPLAAMLIPMLAPPVVPHGLACAKAAPSDAARPALILHAMGLKKLEEDFLKAAVTEENPPVELRLLLAETNSEQNHSAVALYDALKIAPAYAEMGFSDLPKEVWELLYPPAYWKLVERQARLDHLNPYLVMGLIRQESGFSAHAQSVADARGLMQILPETAAHSHRRTRIRAAARRLYDPTYNVRVGCAYLAGLMKEFDGRPDMAMAAYHAGDFRVRDWVAKYTFHDPETFLESIPIPTTRAYVELVLRDAEVYRQLMTGSPQFATCPGHGADLSRQAEPIGAGAHAPALHR